MQHKETGTIYTITLTSAVILIRGYNDSDMLKDQPNSREKKCVISREMSENMPNFTENSRKKFQKFTENSQAPQTLFQGAMLMQTKKSVE